MRPPQVSSPLQVSFRTLNPFAFSYCIVLAMVFCLALACRMFFFLKATRQQYCYFSLRFLFNEAHSLETFLCSSEHYIKHRLLFFLLHDQPLHNTWWLCRLIQFTHYRLILFSFPASFIKNTNNYYFFCDCLLESSLP